jgi:hypothetical protein
VGRCGSVGAKSVNIFSGALTPVLADTRNRSRSSTVSRIGVDRMQRNFGPMRKQVEAPQRSDLTDATAKVVIYAVFVEVQLEAPNHLSRAVTL